MHFLEEMGLHFLNKKSSSQTTLTSIDNTDIPSLRTGTKFWLHLPLLYIPYSVCHHITSFLHKITRIWPFLLLCPLYKHRSSSLALTHVNFQTASPSGQESVFSLCVKCCQASCLFQVHLLSMSLQFSKGSYTKASKTAITLSLCSRRTSITVWQVIL